MKNQTPSRGGALPVLCVMSALLFSVASLLAAPKDKDRGQLSPTDYEFACTAATGSQFEVEAGRLAMLKAVLPAVRQFGEQMISDHNKVGDALKAIAVNRGAVLPAGLTDKQQKELDRLSQLARPDFDKEYTDLMLEDHKKDLKEFQQGVKKVHDPELKLFATETSRIIEQHLAMVTSLREETKPEVKAEKRGARR